PQLPQGLDRLRSGAPPGPAGLRSREPQRNGTGPTQSSPSTQPQREPAHQTRPTSPTKAKRPRRKGNAARPTRPDHQPKAPTPLPPPRRTPPHPRTYADNASRTAPLFHDTVT